LKDSPARRGFFSPRPFDGSRADAVLDGELFGGFLLGLNLIPSNRVLIDAAYSLLRPVVPAPEQKRELVAP